MQTIYGAKWVNPHSKICLYTSVCSFYWNLYKDLYLGTEGVINIIHFLKFEVLINTLPHIIVRCTYTLHVIINIILPLSGKSNLNHWIIKKWLIVEAACSSSSFFASASARRPMLSLMNRSQTDLPLSNPVQSII